MARTFETPLERRQRVLKSARHRFLLLRLDVVMFFTRKRAQQIFAADDSDHLPVPHHGHALDAIGGKHTRNLAGVGVLANGDDGL
jgi:hypothetical protein